MATLFIADLHLCVEEPAITAGFLRFLAGEARKADALYILGDLFEAWIGDDDPNPLHRQMAAAIKRCPIPAFPVISFMATVIFCSANALPVKVA